MKLKSIIVLFFIFLGIQQSYSQKYKFMATGFSVLEKEPSGSWGKWSDLKESNVMIVLDTDKNRIVVYSQEIQLFEIVNYEQKQENDNEEIHPFLCQDNDGEKFSISIIKRKNQGNRKQLYIKHPNVVVVYNIINFPEKSDK